MQHAADVGMADGDGGVGEAAHQVETHSTRRRGRHRRWRLEHVPQGAAAHEAHRVGQLPRGGTQHVVDGDDAGVVEARRQRGLVEEASLAGVAAAPQALEGHLALQARVPGDEDLAHAALAEARQDPVALGLVVGGRARCAAVTAGGLRERGPAAVVVRVVHGSDLVDEGVAVGEDELDEAVAIGTHEVGPDAFAAQPGPQTRHLGVPATTQQRLGHGLGPYLAGDDVPRDGSSEGDELAHDAGPDAGEQAGLGAALTKIWTDW